MPTHVSINCVCVYHAHEGTYRYDTTYATEVVKSCLEHHYEQAMALLRAAADGHGHALIAGIGERTIGAITNDEYFWLDEELTLKSENARCED